MSPSEFEGRVVMLVGAARGIGKATSELFAEQGAILVMVDISPDVEDALRQIQKKYRGVKGLALRSDISKCEDCQRVAQMAYSEFGRIDVLAVISGILHVANLVKDFPPEEWDRVMDVNLKGPFLICRAVVPYMMEERNGRIINVASWWGRSGHGYYSAYCSSKAGLIVFTQALAEEMAEYNVTVNTICPGNVNTLMHQKALTEEAEKRGITFEEMKRIEWAKIPLKKAGDPEDIGNAILFLASDKAKYITGASIDVNGGVLFH